VAIHEIPQEIGDFGVLLHSGFKPKRALFLNFMVALTVLVGGIVGFIISSKMEMLSSYILPVAAGGFIYIATSDLLPEIRKEKSLGKSAISFMIFILGIALMALLKFIGK
jgi:zinc and cadmium transporter